MIIVAALAHFMAHTAAAATVFPILMAIYSLYGEGDKPTKFGKALFIGMAYAAGAGSIVTMLGSARAPAGGGHVQGIHRQGYHLFRSVHLPLSHRLGHGFSDLGLF